MLSDSPSFRQGPGSLVEPAAGEGWVLHPPAARTTKWSGDPPPPRTTATGKKILIVQGDWEAGMALLAQDLEDAGHEVGKVLFCAPDYVYRLKGIRTHSFRKPLEEFDGWLRQLVRDEGYDTFFLYNHYRPYNQIAWNLAEELDLDCQVFELGLIRPNCVMVFDRQNTPLVALSREWEKLLNDERDEPAPEEMPQELCQVSTPVKMASFCANFLFSRLTSPLFPNFVDQRDMNLWTHFKHGMIHLWRFLERGRDAELDEVIAGEWSGTYYAVPLQVHSDTQITRCSNYDSIEQFIKEVVTSFANHAPADTKLIFKVHPMDRGYKDYADLIAGLDLRLGGGRLIYVDRVHLPTLLSNSLGVVNINSSVGISGLVHHAPVIALGTAVYDLPKLTWQGGLDEFWTKAKRPKAAMVTRFIHLLLELNQGRGTLSQRCFDVPGRCRIRWPQPFQRSFLAREATEEDEIADDAPTSRVLCQTATRGRVPDRVGT